MPLRAKITLWVWSLLNAVGMLFLGYLSVGFFQSWLARLRSPVSEQINSLPDEGLFRFALSLLLLAIFALLNVVGSYRCYHNKLWGYGLFWLVWIGQIVVMYYLLNSFFAMILAAVVYRVILLLLYRLIDRRGCQSQPSSATLDLPGETGADCGSGPR